jgi:type IV pilus biogenesis protein CpaD/CtpE
MNSFNLIGLVSAALLVSGCAYNSEADYGSSVRQMVQSQTFDPAAASNPPELAPEVTDGERVKNALDVYRKDVAKGSTDVKQPIVFEIGNN